MITFRKRENTKTRRNHKEGADRSYTAWFREYKINGGKEKFTDEENNSL